jgi:hypothetical protein
MLERWTDPKGRWCSPRKMFDYYVEDAVPDFEEAKRQLFRAVIDGEVWTRVNGVALGPEQLKQVATFKPDDTDPWALPPDLELSVEDARRKWLGA